MAANKGHSLPAERAKRTRRREIEQNSGERIAVWKEKMVGEHGLEPWTR
jgi:hypothetical protein